MVENFTNKNITIMGLGLHGGGLASALFFLKRGAKVTITDLRSKEVLEPTIEKLKEFDVTYILGYHRDEDFINADIVIKNPGVPKTSKYLKMAKRIETDISIFLNEVKCPIIAITGSKGKSSTVSAIYHVLKKVNPNTRLGGNITVSPLTFIEEINNNTQVILELSSWQLADLKGKESFKPLISAVTNIKKDHQNAYSSMDEYASDKGVILENVTNMGIINYTDPYKTFFEKIIPITPVYFSNRPVPDNYTGAFIDQNKEGWFKDSKGSIKILSNKLEILGEHQRENLLLAAMILFKLSVEPEIIIKELSNFTGIAHRMECFCTKNNVKFYNDSAATIPDATVAAVEAINTPIRLICGGTDKELDFECVRDVFKKPVSIFLLEGTGTDKLRLILNEEEIEYQGPYPSLDSLLNDFIPTLKSGDSVLFSPGATSFGMFLNEFDRGNQFKSKILSI